MLWSQAPLSLTAPPPKPGTAERSSQVTTDGLRRWMEHLLGVPTTRSNEVEICRNGDELFPAMLAAITDATHSIELLSFIYGDGQIAQDIAQALAEAARRGVDVRVLVDGFTMKDMDPAVGKKLLRAGVLFEVFRPIPSWRLWRLNSRTHRRVLVCDEEVAFTGHCQEMPNPGCWYSPRWRSFRWANRFGARVRSRHMSCSPAPPSPRRHRC